LDELVIDNPDSSPLDTNITKDVISAHGRRLKKRCLDEVSPEVKI